MKKQELSLMRSWIKITTLLIQLKKAWDEHNEIWLATPKDNIQMLPTKYQRFLSRNFNRSRFDVALPRLVDFWRTIGGVEALRVVPSPEEIIKKLKEKKEKK